MRRWLIIGAMVLVAVPAAAQVKVASEPPPITHGEVAQLVLKVFATKPGPELAPAVALAKAKQLELVPAGWTAEAPLTEAELEELLHKLCPSARFQAAKPANTVTRPFVEAWFRRSSPCVEEYLARLSGHGTSDTLILDEGVDRAVSPSGFQK
ncbi:MAG: hypothetical protein D6729_13440 [Deltaproteobacteria bacterium]|nr:MAG: hypothetical protein D6729_13440 [Deltaproteobacteria bacterium]